MIYLIGGSSSSGKTILSRKLSKNINVPYISTDHIRQIILPYFKGAEKNKKFPVDKMVNMKNVEKYFLDYTPRQILNASIVESRSAWPGLKQFINHLILCKMDYIIEGLYLLPSLVKEFKSNRNIKVLYLIKQDEEKLYKALFNDKGVMTHVKSKDVIRLAARSMSNYGKYFSKEAKKYNYKSINTEDDFQRQLTKAVHFFTN